MNDTVVGWIQTLSPPTLLIVFLTFAIKILWARDEKRDKLTQDTITAIVDRYENKITEKDGTIMGLVAKHESRVAELIDREDHREEQRDASWQKFLKSEREAQESSRQVAMQHGLDAMAQLTEAHHRHVTLSENRFDLLLNEIKKNG